MARSDRPPALRPRPAQISTARRTTERSVGALLGAAAHALEPVAGRAACGGLPALEKHAHRAIHGQLCSRASRAVRRRSARRAPGRRALDKHGRVHFPAASVPTCVRPAARVCMRSMSEIARSTSPEAMTRPPESPSRRRRDQVQSERARIASSRPVRRGAKTVRVVPRFAILSSEPDRSFRRHNK